MIDNANDEERLTGEWSTCLQEFAGSIPSPFDLEMFEWNSSETGSNLSCEYN